MRSLSTTEQMLLASEGYSVRLRVTVKDASGSDVELTNFEGRDWVQSVDISNDVDQPVSEATVTLVGHEDELNLSPSVAASKINRPGGVFQERLGVNRQIAIEVGIAPEHGGDPDYWHALFVGDVDEFDLPSDGVSSQIRLRCRDLGGRLQRRWLERTGQPPTGTELAVNLYQTERAVEDVMQEILGDWGPGGITLQVPVSPGWEIPNGTWEPEMTNVLEVLRSLASRIGWDVRYRWVGDETTGSYQLQFYEPPRGKTTPDMTLGPDQYFAISRFATSLIGIRNKIEVFYRTSANEDDDVVVSVVEQDLASQATYGLLYSSIGENDTTGITNSTRATQLASAVLSDLKNPRADFSATAMFLWNVELYDLIRFSPNGLLFDADQDLAVVGYRHHISTDRVETEIVCRGGTVVGSWRKHWDLLRDKDGDSRAAPPAPSLSKSETIRGVKLMVANVPHKHRAIEFYLSTTSPVVLGAATLRGRGRFTTLQLSDLIQGQTYYAVARLLGANGIPSAVSNEVIITPGKASAFDLSVLDYVDVKDTDASPQGDRRWQVKGGVFQAATTGGAEVGSAIRLADPIIKDTDASPVADRVLRVSGGEFETTTTAGAPGQFIKGSALKEGTGPLAHLSATGTLDSLASVTTKRISHLIGTQTGDGQFPHAVVFDRAVTNYLTNPSFEVNTSGWNVVGTASLSAGNFGGAVAGQNALEIQIPTGAASHGAESAYAVASSGQTWCFAPYVLTSGGQKLRIHLQFQNGSGTPLQTETLEFSPPVAGVSSMERRHVTAVAPGTTERVVCAITNDGKDQGAFVIYADACQLELGVDAPSAYVDGTLGPDYSWSGTAHSSTSSRAAGACFLKTPTHPFAIRADGVLEARGLHVGGNEFPTSPRLHDVFFRTDRRALYYWDGTAWQLMQDQVAWRVYQTVNQPTPAPNTLTKVRYTSAYAPAPVIDLSSGFDRPNSRFVCPVKGIYSYTIRLGWSNPQATQRCSQYLYKNGAAYELVCVAINDATGGSVPYYRAQGIVNCNAGDYLEHWVYEDGSVGNRVVTGGTFEGFLAIAQP